MKTLAVTCLALALATPVRAATVLCAGDSQVGSWGGWGYNICQRLATIRPDLQTETISFPSQTSFYVRDQLALWLQSHPTPDYVVLFAGVNDYAVDTPIRVASGLRTTARNTKQAGVKVVYVLTLPPVGTLAVPKAAHNVFTRAVSAELAGFTWQPGTELVDVRYVFELQGWSANAFPNDGIHILAWGNDWIAEKLAGVIP